MKNKPKEEEKHSEENQNHEEVKNEVDDDDVFILFYCNFREIAKAVGF